MRIIEVALFVPWEVFHAPHCDRPAGGIDDAIGGAGEILRAQRARLWRRIQVGRTCSDVSFTAAVQPIAPIAPIAPLGSGTQVSPPGWIGQGQFRPGLPVFGGGFGWFPYYGYGYGGYGYGYGTTSNTVNVYPTYYVPVGPSEPDVQLSGLANATLILQFPADAEVWLNGKKGEGEPQTEWTLDLARSADRPGIPV